MNESTRDLYESMKSTSSTNVEDLTQILDDLRLSALLSAAKASKQSYRVSIGANVEVQVDSPAKKEKTPEKKSTEEKENVKPHEEKPPQSSPVNLDDIKYFSARYSIKRLEKQVAENVRKELQERHRRHTEADKKIQERFIEANRAAEENMLRKMLENEKALKEAIAVHEKASKEFELELKQKTEESRRRGMEIKQRSQVLEKFRALHDLFKRAIDRFMKAFTGFDKDMQEAFTNYKTAVFQTTKHFDDQLGYLDKTILNEEELDLAQKLYKNVDSLTTEMIKKANDIKEAQEAAVKAAAVEEQKKQAEKTAAEKAEKDRLAAEQQQKVKDTVDSTPNTSAGMDQFVHPDVYKRYERIMTIYKLHSDAVKKLSEDENMKKYRMMCQYAVNIPINTISATSSQHLQDKYDKLATLLSGAIVRTSSGEISVNQHPLGKTYCTMLLSKKFVNQSDTIVSNTSVEFPIAATLVSLWKQFPDVGQFFLAYLYKECPYFVPYFIPQLAGQTDEDYMKSLGYRISNGNMEKQDQYLKRMCGIARLYAAVWITRPRRGDSTPHPHGLENGWRWLINIINLDPLPDICATLIHESLSVAGDAMMQTYGKQFFKLLLTIQRQYLVKLNQVDHGGPKARLEEFINRAIQEQKIAPPEKMLPSGFW